MIINNKKKKIEIPDSEIKKVSELGKIRGLMFRKKENAPILLFKFKKTTKQPIHSFFVYFPFLGLWLDEDNKVVEKRIVYPWKRMVFPSRKFKKLIEIPLSSNFEEIIGKISPASSEIRKI